MASFMVVDSIATTICSDAAEIVKNLTCNPVFGPASKDVGLATVQYSSSTDGILVLGCLGVRREGI